jgi:hypothetical protein
MVVATFLLVVATSILAYWAWKTASTAKTTEDVFKDIVKTLEDTQRRSEATAVVRTMSDCIKQYQDLENNLQNKTLKRPERYFELLWDLHFAEFQFFIRWFLPDDVYGLWVWVRYQSYDARETKLGWTEFDGWKYGKAYLQDEKFASFIDGVFGRSGLKKEDVIRYVENYPRPEAGLTGMGNQSMKPTGPISK